MSAAGQQRRDNFSISTLKGGVSRSELSTTRGRKFQITFEGACSQFTLGRDFGNLTLQASTADGDERFVQLMAISVGQMSNHPYINPVMNLFAILLTSGDCGPVRPGKPGRPVMQGSPQYGLSLIHI